MTITTAHPYVVAFVIGTLTGVVVSVAWEVGRSLVFHLRRRRRP